MASYNKITLVGNVGSDPQLKVFEQSKVAEFSVAVNESYNDRNGQRVEKTDWFRIGVWGQRADVIMNYVKRGAQIMIEGKLTVRTWQDAASGKERFGLDVRASDFVLLGGPNSDGRSQLPPPGAPSSAFNSNVASSPSTYSTAPQSHQSAVAHDPLAGNSQYSSGGGSNQQDNDDLPF